MFYQQSVVKWPIFCKGLVCAESNTYSVPQNKAENVCLSLLSDTCRFVKDKHTGLIFGAPCIPQLEEQFAFYFSI